jgi:hypothetical protein
LSAIFAPSVQRKTQRYREAATRFNPHHCHSREMGKVVLDC